MAYLVAICMAVLLACSRVTPRLMLSVLRMIFWQVAIVNTWSGSVGVDYEVMPPQGVSVDACCDSIAVSLNAQSIATLATALTEQLGHPINVSVVSAPHVVESEMATIWASAEAAGMTEKLVALQMAYNQRRVRSYSDGAGVRAELAATKRRMAGLQSEMRQLKGRHALRLLGRRRRDWRCSPRRWPPHPTWRSARSCRRLG